METQKYDPNEMLKQMAAEAVKQQAHVRAAVRDLTLNALEAREFGINQVKSIVRKIAEGVSSGLGEKSNAEKLISDAVAGMDDALLKVVEANEVALSKLSGSSSFDDSMVAKALRELETLEEQFRDGVKKGTEAAGAQVKKQWASVLDKIPKNQTEAGEQVLQTLAEHAKQADRAIKATREAGLKLAHTLTQNYATLVSGILMGLTEGMKAQKKRK